MWNKESDAGTNTWSARVAKRNAKISRDLIVKITAEADELDARIKHVADMEEKGFWLCENGHERTDVPLVPQDEGHEIHCGFCEKQMKLVKRSEMTGQEKYESDKDRKDAEKLLPARREEIANKETAAAEQDATAKYFSTQAESSRTLADAIRKL